MKREVALKILKGIVELGGIDITEIKLTQAKKWNGEDIIYDILIEEPNVSHADIQAMDDFLADYDNIEMNIELSQSQIRIFERVEEDKEVG